MSGLEEMRDSMSRLGEIEERTAQIAAPLLEQTLKATASAGQAPDGRPWAPKKKGGGRPMVNAAKAITVKAFGKVVRAVLTGAEVFWHYGVHGAPRRPIIPDAGAGMPPVVAEVLDKASAKAFEEITGGRRA